MKRLLFVRTDRLGETILTLPAAACLKAAFPGASLTYFVQPALNPLLARLPWIDRVWSIEEPPTTPWWLRAHRAAGHWRGERFDLAVIANPKKEWHLAAWLARIPIRVGYARKWGGLLTHRISDAKMLGGRHEVEYNLDLITALGLPREIPSWSFPPFTHEAQQLAQWLGGLGVSADEPLVAVHPWTSNPAKQWPPDRFRRLLEDLSRQPGFSTVIIGGPEEQPNAARLLTPSIPRIIDLTGRLTLPELAAFFQRVRLVVSNDSGPVHLAAAVGAKVVVLFRTDDPAAGPARWGPWGNGHRIIAKPSLTQISVDDVRTCIARQLASPAVA